MNDFHEVFSFLNYDQWRLSWYSYLDLLNINYTEGFQCSVCGEVPETVVCDATSLGFQKKFAKIAFPKEIRNPSQMIPRFS